MDRNAARNRHSLLLALVVIVGVSTTFPSRAGDGVIFISRDVQPRMAARAALVPDPNPHTVNASPSAQVIRATGASELSDAEFAAITSGAGIQRHVLADGQVPGLGSQPALGLPHTAGGRGAGSGLSGQVNRSLQRGLAPLNILTGDR